MTTITLASIREILESIDTVEVLPDMTSPVEVRDGATLMAMSLRMDGGITKEHLENFFAGKKVALYQLIKESDRVAGNFQVKIDSDTFEPSVTPAKPSAYFLRFHQEPK